MAQILNSVYSVFFVSSGALSKTKGFCYLAFGLFLSQSLAYPGRGGGCLGSSNPPRNCEVLKKLGQIPSFVEYTSVTT
jgi:hypothetical protein